MTCVCVFSVVYIITFYTSQMYIYPFLNDKRYQQVFAQVIALEGQEVQIKEKRYVMLLARRDDSDFCKNVENLFCLVSLDYSELYFM